MKLDTLLAPLYRLEIRPNYLLSQLQQKIQEAKFQKGKKCGIIKKEVKKDERDRESKDNK